MTTKATERERVARLTDTGGCPVCDSGRGVQWIDGIAYLFDYHCTQHAAVAW